MDHPPKTDPGAEDAAGVNILPPMSAAHKRLLVKRFTHEMERKKELIEKEMTRLVRVLGRLRKARDQAKRLERRIDALKA